MKKLLLGLGAVTSIIAPITAVVACSNGKKSGTYSSQIRQKYAIGKDSASLKLLVDDYASAKDKSKFLAIMTEISNIADNTGMAYDRSPEPEISLDGDTLTISFKKSSDEGVWTQRYIYTLTHRKVYAANPFLKATITSIKDEDFTPDGHKTSGQAFTDIQIKSVLTALKGLHVIDGKGTRVYFEADPLMKQAVKLLGSSTTIVTKYLDANANLKDKNPLTKAGYYIDGTTGTVAFSSVSDNQERVTYLFTITFG